jgi:class 3 adenylate cyclase
MTDKGINIPGITNQIFTEVVASQMHHESSILLLDKDFSQSASFKYLLFFLGVTYNQSRFSEEIIRIENFLYNRQQLLSAFESGIYYHLKGYMYSKKGTDQYHIVFDALNKSFEYLKSAKCKAAKYYLARVSDTYGQVLQTIGFYRDALVLFQESLKIKKAFKDQHAMALTYGNIGRLYLEIGDFKQGIKHLEYDFEIIRQSPHTEYMQSKLLNQIAMGWMEINKSSYAKKLIDQSMVFSKKAGFESYFFTLYTLAYYYMQSLEIDKFRKTISKLQKILSTENSAVCSGIFQSRIDYLTGMIALFNNKPLKAHNLFRKTVDTFMSDITNSITQKARFYFQQSLASYKSGHINESSSQLRDALSLLDQTENTSLRKEYEATLKERHKDAWLLHTAGRFIGQDQIEMILDNTGGEGFQGESTELAVMFSDIRDFTNISEGITAEELIELLNRYFSTMSKYVHLQGGIIDKYIGDCIMALYFPNSSNNKSVVENACTSAIMMKYELLRFNRYLPVGKNEIHAGIGINYGTCVSGLIGTPQKRSLSVIGDTVNMASRMEGLTKLLGSTIIISEPVYSRLPENHNFIIRPLGKFKPKGKAIPLALAELIGIDNNSPEAITMKSEIVFAEKILNEYAAGNLKQAYSGFIDLMKWSKNHYRYNGYNFMAGYTKKLLDTCIPQEWDGSFQLFSK